MRLLGLVGRHARFCWLSPAPFAWIVRDWVSDSGGKSSGVRSNVEIVRAWTFSGCPLAARANRKEKGVSKERPVHSKKNLRRRVSVHEYPVRKAFRPDRSFCWRIGTEWRTHIQAT